MTSLAKFWLVVAVAGLAIVSTGRAETAKKKVVASSQQQAGCPVAMVAWQAAGNATPAMAKSQAAGSAPAQRIQFKLTNAKLGAIAAVRIRVNGWNGAAHRMPTVQVNERKVTGSKTMELKVSIGPRETAETDAWVHGLTSVNSIDLMSVEYADGSSWKAKSADACSVVPDPIMLISKR
jgi:hypothetical protein